MSNNGLLYDFLSQKIKEKEQYSLTLADYVRPIVAKGETVTISGKGNSMLPTIDEKCKLTMAPIIDYRIRVGDILLYSRPDSSSVIHRVWQMNKDEFAMLGDNQISIEHNVPKGAVVAYVKKITYADGREKTGHQSVLTMRLRYFRRRNMYYFRAILSKVRHIIM